jgi:hypothetical protein
MLYALARDPGCVRSASDLLGHEIPAEARHHADLHVQALRAALGSMRASLQSAPGGGYRFSA